MFAWRLDPVRPGFEDFDDLSEGHQAFCFDDLDLYTITGSGKSDEDGQPIGVSDSITARNDAFDRYFENVVSVGQNL